MKHLLISMPIIRCQYVCGEHQIAILNLQISILAPKMKMRREISSNQNSEIGNKNPENDIHESQILIFRVSRLELNACD